MNCIQEMIIVVKLSIFLPFLTLKKNANYLMEYFVTFILVEIVENWLKI